MRYLIFLIGVILTSCSVLRNKPHSQLSTGEYLFRQHGQRYHKIFAEVHEDTIKLFTMDRQPFHSQKGLTEYLLRRTVDVDVVTVPFKYRPAVPSLPRQLNTNINGNLFVGYRIDRFKVDVEETPAGIIKNQKHRALSVGAFGGMGNTFMSPWTTNYQITDEYEAFILSRGIALMAGVNNLTVGVGMGWDYVTDRDKHVWIYQNKPWYGVTLGLNLN